jgi:chromosome segregation ATPase
MRNTLPICLLGLALVLSGPARAENETARLREALRSATAQVRSLEDQRTAVQAKLTTTEQERDTAKKQAKALRDQVKEAEQSYRQAVKDFNDRLAERDETLEKWKLAYAEAASVARTKDAERTKFEGEAKAFKASTKACEAKNGQLVKTSNDVVTKYEAMNPLEKVLDHDPVFGLHRVIHQNEVQELRDKILDQKAKP